MIIISMVYTTGNCDPWLPPFFSFLNFDARTWMLENPSQAVTFNHHHQAIHSTMVERCYRIYYEIFTAVNGRKERARSERDTYAYERHRMPLLRTKTSSIRTPCLTYLNQARLFCFGKKQNELIQVEHAIFVFVHDPASNRSAIRVLEKFFTLNPYYWLVTNRNDTA
jgi:hypothetical protein